LAEFDDLDEQTNGLLINSENFQALGLMQEKYQERVTSVYIDPPYNTEGDGFIYKDSFKHSSWLSLMYDRLYFSKSMLYENANLFTSIDNREQENLKLLLCNVFGSENFVESFLWTKTSTPPALSNKSRKTVEYIHCFEKNVCNLEYCGELLDNGDAPLLNSGNPIKALVFPPKSIRFKIPDGLISPSIPDKVEILNSFNIKNGFNVEEVTLKGQFKWKQETLIEEIQKGTYFIVKSEKFSIRFQREDVGGYKAPNNMLSTELDKNENVDTNEGALKEINNLGIFDFSFPKPSSLIGKLLNFNQLLENDKLFLDYFAGSGTTGHATIKLNREDNGNRKYILVEMGTYFNTVTKPRIQKVIYSDNWKNGKPQDKAGISQMFKYQVLESYEDTLNNLILSDVGNQAQLDFSERAQEEYLLHYMLEMESREHLFNLEMFRKPFSYQLKVTENNELKPTKVDLVETFNYLIGLYVSKVQRVKDIKVVEGVTRTGIKTLVIWRDMETTTHDDVLKLVRRFYDSARTREFQQIYINGDHHLENLRTDGDQFKIKMIEEIFFKKMFNESVL
jgi:adenine-specific DNA-methyltransferase